MGGVIIIVDPLFHYHPPLKGIQYILDNERYQNNGIVKNFDYDAIITGSSMTENFKTSEFDECFGCNSIKVPFSGGSYREVNENLEIAVEHNSNIKMILRGLDYGAIISEPDYMRYDIYPDYLYDDCVFNDVYYIFNKEIWIDKTLAAFLYTLEGNATTTFDQYSSWNDFYNYGAEAVKGTYERKEKASEIVKLTKKDKEIIKENVTQNVLRLAIDNPQIEFYYFFTPYSILYFDKLNQEGYLERMLDAEKYAIELLLGYDNIHLYSFNSEYEIICNLENFKDIYHYKGEINSLILKYISNGMDEINENTYQTYCAGIREFYLNYDYEAFFN